MAAGKKSREIQFTLNDDDFKMFGHYRILYTDQGHKLVRRQRLTYLISAAALAGLFTVFHVDKNFTILVYIIAAAMAVVGLLFAETLVLKQQDNVIAKTEYSAERVHAAQHRIRFEEDGFTTYAGDDEQHFDYKDVKLMDFTDSAIYVWLSDEMIMPIPEHAFRNMSEMKEFNKWLKERIEENGGTVK
jgi:hypothetical protein